MDEWSCSREDTINLELNLENYLRKLLFLISYAQYADLTNVLALHPKFQLEFVGKAGGGHGGGGGGGGGWPRALLPRRPRSTRRWPNLSRK